MGYRIAVDTGGTFTDFCVMDEAEGSIFVEKVPSTPSNPADAIVSGIEKIIDSRKCSGEDVTFLLHGTTVATNTLLEKKGAKTALITTKGFRDVLQIGRQARPFLYELTANRNEVIIPREYRFEADERILFTGEIKKSLNKDEIREICSVIRSEGIEAVAVCLLHSYANPVHEREIAEILRQEVPDVFVTLSSDILPEFREYERMSTVCINAYVMPKVSKYVDDLETKIRGKKISSDLYIMQSNGGVITAEAARESSARTVLSGPAGGALAGRNLCRQTGIDNVITIDMGGTSLDICLLEGGRPRYTTESQIAGYPIKLPMIEINTIGSGGGSLAWIDDGGAMRVGPESAGAVPGPVCYCKGGNVPTVTDANAVLGRINQKYLLNGDFTIDVERAKKAIKEKIADPLGISVIDAAYGIIKVVNANMVRGIRVVSVEKGYDPREFAMVAFGGAGPLHGCDLAEELGMNRVIVPKNPGVFSAMGMLTADVRHDYVRTFVRDADEVDIRELSDAISEITHAAFDELRNEGFDRDTMDIGFSLDMRYKGQAYEISIPLEYERYLDHRAVRDAVMGFHATHKRAYGYNRTESVVEIVNIRAVAFGRLPQASAKREHKKEHSAPEPAAYRDVYMKGGEVRTSVYDRESLRFGDTIQGPAIVEQLDSTTVIQPGNTCFVDEYLNLHIYLNGAVGQ